MSAVTYIAITHDSRVAAEGIRELIGMQSTQSPNKHQLANRMEKLFAGLSSGALTGGVEVIVVDTTSPAQASVTITPTHANLTAGDTINIGAITLTATAGAPGANQFQIGANLAADCTNIAASINTNMGAVFSAVATSTTVVVTAQLTGVIMSAITVTTNDATAIAFSSPSFTGAGTTSSLASTLRKVFNYGTAQV